MEWTLQTVSLKDYFEDLATPKAHNHFDDEYLENSKFCVSLIRKLKVTNQTKLFTSAEIVSCVKQLNSGKSPDEFGLSAEQLKAAGDTIVPALRDIFNEILKTGIIPECFKGGVLTPVPKSGKDAKLMDNYRGITVTSIIGKLFEKLLLLRLLENINVNQSDCQFGFTKNLNPLMSSVICSEAIVESKARGQPLYLVTIDTQKAFDVGNHVILKKNVFEKGVATDLWNIVDHLYSDMSSKVKWQCELSSSFPILQGVRQVGILSTHFYKLYVDPLLHDLKQQSLCADIGTTYVGALAVADDFLFLSNSADELQIMLNLKHMYSGERRYRVQPTKPVLIPRITTAAASRKADQNCVFYVGESEISTSNSTEHSGLVRSQKMKHTKETQFGQKDIILVNKNWCTWLQWAKPKNFLQNISSICTAQATIRS